MKLPTDAQVRSQSQTQLDAWRGFLRINCDALFQTALLLTADPREAEASLFAAIETLDLSEFPDDKALITMQENVVQRAVQIARPLDSSKLLDAGAMLQTGLRSILQIHTSSRVCFVLRTLLGYTTPLCAQIMAVEEAAVQELLRIAFLQLRSAVIRTESPQTNSRLCAMNAGILPTEEPHGGFRGSCSPL